ncbi:kinesin light chain [Klebsormidium nitens]|uniref:Kinesin light chain n=1 Tax=Klebsormidium nitens TaxID=105231 RepID=A0A1Y1HY84_KLENI|nr:kinesin light chain [Klebsormidium nitens]|eukprot:GAQ83640.1 kinesin light chain [Klebsormidium nitens]
MCCRCTSAPCASGQGAEHPDLVTTLNHTAGLLEKQGEYAKPLPLFERALRVREGALGPEHPHVASSLNDMSGLLENQGKSAKAMSLYVRALRIGEKALRPGSPGPGG